MNIVLTGSLGHISKPLAEDLIKKGHAITVISSNAERRKAIEDLGAKAEIGTIEDIAFLINVFKGADIVYLMMPPFNFFDQDIDMNTYWPNLATNYRRAILESGVKRLVYLSSIGAHLSEGIGMLNIHNSIENIITDLPNDVSVKIMRPVSFYYNIYGFLPGIKEHGAIFSNYGGDWKEPWVSPIDIASVISEEMETPFKGKTIRYIASDEISPNEIARILGAAIGKPDLKWITIPDEQFLAALLAAGFNPQVATGFVEMNTGRLNHLYDDYHRNKPTLGKTKLTDFANEFASVFNQ